MEYRIVEKEAFKIVGIKEWITLENGQNTTLIPQMWSNLPRETHERIGALANTELTGVLGVCGDMSGGGFDYWIAAATTLPCPEGLWEKEIPALTWAVFESIGPLPTALQAVWGRVFGEWFPGSGYEHAQAPELEWYSEGDVQAEDYRSEVWIPVVRK